MPKGLELVYAGTSLAGRRVTLVRDRDEGLYTIVRSKVNPNQRENERETPFEDLAEAIYGLFLRDLTSPEHEWQ
jgi:hypothetical protein